MPMTIYKLHFSAAATADSLASLDIQLDGEINAIHMTGKCAGADGLNDGFNAEVSFLSSNSFTSNDTRGSLMIIQSELGFLTTGGHNGSVNAQVSSLFIPVSAGERIHLHMQLNGAPTGVNVHCFLYVQDKGIARASSRRR